MTDFMLSPVAESVQAAIGDDHARLGPSNERWEPCPGSVREEAKYPDVSTAAAMDGTGSHLLLEMCCKNGVRAEQYVGQTIGVGHKDSPNEMGWFVDPDRARRVQLCLDYIETRIKGLREQYKDPTIIACVSETKSNPGAVYGRDDWWGTCDINIFVTYDGNRRLVYYETLDYKDGKRYVSEKSNQLRDYLLGKVAPFLFEENRSIDPDCVLVTTIVQPKTNNPVRSATVSQEELFDHGDRRLEAANRTDDPDAPLVPGKHCFFCKHQDNCDAKKQEKIQKGAIMEHNIVERVETALQTMSNDELAKILDAKEALAPAFAKAEEEAFKRIEAGQELPGYFIGNGRASRVWNEDEEVIAKKLKGMGFKKDEIYPPKLVTPAQAAKKSDLSEQKQKNLEKLVTTMAGNKTLKRGERVQQQAKSDVKSLFMGKPEQDQEKPKFNFMG